MNTAAEYRAFLKRRMSIPPDAGLDPASITLGTHLYPHQVALTRWALAKGRAAVFADTGLGKTAIQLDWAQNVSREGRVLIVTPLAVAGQTVQESIRWGIEGVKYARSDDGSKITVTNYEHISKFNPDAFVGVVIDESSILKNFTGAVRNQIIDTFRWTKYRLACTATPAPNDYMELGNHSEFLGVYTRSEMLSEYFVHDGGRTSQWRLKGHAEGPFWEWVSSWAAVVQKPSDLGFDDGAYQLPPLNVHECVIKADHENAWSEGYLFAQDALTLSDQRAIRRATISQRVERCSDLAQGSDPCLIWCELNDESGAISRAIPDAIEVRGSDSLDDKIEKLTGFSDGRFRVLVTKPSIAGFGMNWQHCARVIFAGASHSYEQTYQAIRRCWRFGQQRPVDVFIIAAEQESEVIANYHRKEMECEEMRKQMLVHMRDLTRRSVTGDDQPSRWIEYHPTQEVETPRWMLT